MLVWYAVGLVVGALLMAVVFPIVERVTRGRRAKWLRRRGLGFLA